MTGVEITCTVGVVLEREQQVSNQDEPCAVARASNARVWW